MRKKLWINLALLLVIPGFLFTVSCAKKVVKSEPAIIQAPEAEELIEAREAAEKARKEELARQRAIEEQRLREERLREERLRERAAKREIITARQRFENEDINFEFDRSRVLPRAQEILKKKAKWLRNNSGVSVIIEGHCDERGTNEYNIALGDRRANSAKNFLINLGIAASRLTTISYGEERPLDPGHNIQAWAKNRRAHFVIE